MKKIPLPNANGLQMTPVDTIKLLELLYRVGFEQVTDNDRAFARSVLIRSASLYPEYANYSGPTKPTVRPALTPLRHKKRG